MTTQLADRRATLLRRAWWLAAFTIVWNLAEGAVAVTAPALARSRALVGFGVNSFVESASSTVLIWRLRVEQRSPERAEHVEQRALKIIGVTFIALAALVGVESLRPLMAGEQPDVSRTGIVLTIVSLIVMPLLAREKRRVGRGLGARSVEPDSQQSQA